MLQISEWQRTQTTRRYLTPPMSERLYTFWREGKIVFGEMDVAVTTKIYKNTIVSAGLWFLYGKDLTPFDFRDARMLMHPDGIPVHAQKHSTGIFDVTIEAFADFEVRPNGYVKVTVQNPRQTAAQDTIAFMLRTGLEKDIVFCGPDVYDIYQPTTDPWYAMPASWQHNGSVYSDPEGRTLTAHGDIPFTFCEENGIARAELSLAPGESRQIIFAYNIGKVYEFDYEQQKALCTRRWEQELNRINKLPAAIQHNPALVKIIRNLTVQLLQCFALPKGMDLVFARQGCLQRQIWLFETMSVIEALSRIGEFGDYIEPVIDSYFSQFQTESGEIVPLAIPWAMATANALQTFGKYAIIRGREYFERYKDRAQKAFEWIRSTRVQTSDRPEIIVGLFPPKASCDDQFVFQSWTNTDTFNIRGLKAFAEACDHFGETSLADELHREIKDYLDTMYRIWNDYVAKATGDHLEIPFTPSLPDEVVRANFAFGTPCGYFLEGLDLPVDQVEKIHRTYTELGSILGGLYDRMPDIDNSSGIASGTLDENGKCLIWYVCTHEYYWFSYYLRHERYDRCCEILNTVFRFAMTDEYYMFERYHQRNIWFAPWSPNASANGRLILMLLDYYNASPEQELTLPS